MFCPAPAPFLLQKQWFATCLCSPLCVELATGRQIVLDVESSAVLRKQKEVSCIHSCPVKDVSFTESYVGRECYCFRSGNNQVSSVVTPLGSESSEWASNCLVLWGGGRWRKSAFLWRSKNLSCTNSPGDCLDVPLTKLVLTRRAIPLDAGSGWTSHCTPTVRREQVVSVWFHLSGRSHHETHIKEGDEASLFGDMGVNELEAALYFLPTQPWDKGAWRF